MGMSQKQPKTQIKPQFMKKQKQQQQHYEKGFVSKPIQMGSLSHCVV